MIRIFCNICTKGLLEPARFDQRSGDAVCKMCDHLWDEFVAGRAEIIRADQKKHEAHLEQYRADFFKKNIEVPKIKKAV